MLDVVLTFQRLLKNEMEYLTLLYLERELIKAVHAEFFCKLVFPHPHTPVGVSRYGSMNPPKMTVSSLVILGLQNDFKLYH